MEIFAEYSQQQQTFCLQTLNAETEFSNKNGTKHWNGCDSTYIYQNYYPPHSKMHSDREYLDCTKLLVAQNPIWVIVFRSL